LSPAYSSAQETAAAGHPSRPADASRKSAAHAARSHTHVVTSGETMAAIARKHGLSITSLEEANPGVNPKKLHVGQVLVLPP
jgi:LysM repeat protein